MAEKHSGFYWLLVPDGFIFSFFFLSIFSAFYLTEFVFFKNKEDNHLNITNFIQSIIYFLLSSNFHVCLFSSLFAVKLKFLKSNIIKNF